jgi:hypothetical protein
MRCPVALENPTLRRYTFPNAVLIPAGVSWLPRFVACAFASRLHLHSIAFRIVRMYAFLLTHPEYAEIELQP